MVIGIEGYVGSGKTSMCREIIKILPNTILFNGGNLYRAIVYSMLERGNTIPDLVKEGKKLDPKEVMDKLNINIRLENNETIYYMGDVKFDEDALQCAGSSLAVSSVGGKANNEKLFEFSRQLIDEYKKDYNVVVAGRSLMAIYPEMDYHFMVKCELGERVKRKLHQYLKDNHIEDYISDEEYEKQYEAVKENIIQRDKLQEEAGFYKIYDKTIELDVTKCKSAKESAELLLTYIK